METDLSNDDLEPLPTTDGGGVFQIILPCGIGYIILILM